MRRKAPCQLLWDVEDHVAEFLSGPSCCCRSSANGCRPQPNNARICSAVTGSPAVRPSIPSMPEAIQTPGVSPHRCSTTARWDLSVASKAATCRVK
jgi:hypothetical protein